MWFQCHASLLRPDWPARTCRVMWTTSTQTLPAVATFPSEDPKRWQRPPIQTTPESPKDVALGAAPRWCSARCHGTALPHLGSPDDATQKCVFLSEGMLRNDAYPSTLENALAQMVQALLTLSSAPDMSPWPWMEACANPHAEVRTATCLRSSRLCCRVQPTMPSFTSACYGPGPGGLPNPAQGDL